MSMPANVARLFETNPSAGMALVEMGHAYGKARFPSTCKLTGIHLPIGGSYRKLAFWTRDGRLFEGHVPAKTAERLQFHGPTFAESVSTWTRWTPEAWEAATANLAKLEHLTTIEVMRDARGSYDVTIGGWVLEVFPNGTRQWTNGETRGRSTDAQLAAALRRLKGAAFFRVLPPWRPSSALPA